MKQDFMLNNENHIEQEFKEINRLTDSGQLKKALKLCEVLFEIYPEHPRVLHGVGMLRYRSDGDREVSESLLRKAIQIKPDFADAYYSLGIMLHNAELQDNAEELFRTALKHDPDNYKAMTSLATVLIINEKIQEAHNWCEKAFKLNSQYANIFVNFGSIMLANSKAHKALEFIRSGLKIKNLDSGDSQLLFVMNMISNCSQKEIFEQSVRWGRKFSHNYTQKPRGHLNSRLHERKLRIGYVSGDLKLHPVAFHLKPVLESHNKENVEIFLYNSFPHVDQLTEDMFGLSDLYRDISAISDEKVEALIRKDGVDILVDLAGHTAFNRLGLFLRKAAPVQVTWLGYFNTTGLSSIDYLISDPITIPSTEDKYFTEQVFRLPDVRFCYQPMPNAPIVGPAPALRNGYITFGSFNALQKITPDAYLLWSRLLCETPGSRIILKSKSFSEECVKESILNSFAACGVSADRIELRPKSSYTDMLAEYGDIDIALDTFPYNGGATTCEALWMGVPVITLEGDTPISRQSKAFLYTIGYPEWVTSNVDEYADVIHKLIVSVDALQEIRSNLRQKMASSALCDGKTFTGNLESAYRQMWQKWCAASAPIVSFRSFSADELYYAGINYLKDDEIQYAFDMFNRTLRRIPNHIDALNGRGKAYEKTGNHLIAEKTFRKAIRFDPSSFNSSFNLGFLLLNSGEFKKARKEFLRALSLVPDHIETLVNLGIVNRMLGHLREAQHFCVKALDISPKYVPALSHLAFVLGDLGESKLAIENLKMAVELQPDNLDVLSGLVAYMFYDINTKQEDIFKLSKQIGSIINKTIPTTNKNSLPFTVRNHLRVGFVSPDFSLHPVGLLLMALFKENISERLSLFCYSNDPTTKPDTLTEWYQNIATTWRDISKISDAEAAVLVQNDKIDILIDLSGHTMRHRLPLFTLCPAPVQVSWMGYGHTTGLDSIDFIIADNDFIRPLDEQWFSEKAMRLPSNRFCFVPPVLCPEVVEPPLYDNDYITFGSFNNPKKISEQVVAVWAQILLRVPRSRLILKYKTFGDKMVRTRYLDLFAKYGVARSRIEFRKDSNSFLMMMEYGEIDIALDPFPFTGGMTSLFSLWMGVPIISLAGEMPISRQSKSFLDLVMLNNLVTYTYDEYVSKAVVLANDPQRLTEIRESLRHTMLESPLCDAKKYASDVCDLFFKMWDDKRSRCAQQSN
jgi:predicted O-linked N-acetylglucosamine transferase (SPINDLY family)